MSDAVEELRKEFVAFKAATSDQLQKLKTENDKLWMAVNGLRQTKMETGQLDAVLRHQYGVRRPMVLR